MLMLNAEEPLVKGDIKKVGPTSDTVMLTNTNLDMEGKVSICNKETEKTMSYTIIGRTRSGSR